MTTRSSRLPVNLAAWISAETDHDRGVLRGLAQFTRQHPHIRVVRLAKSRATLPEPLRTRTVQGVVATIDSPEEARAVRQLGLPLVNVSGQVALSGVPTVNTDDDKVGQWAARYFLERGYQTLAYCGNKMHTGSCIRERSMRRETTERDGVFFTHDLAPAAAGARDPGAVVRGVGAWLRKIPKPVGIFAFSDEVCVLLTDACLEADLRIPEEVAVLGVGLDATRQFFACTSISSIELNTAQIGLRAGQMVLDLVERRPVRVREVLVPPLKIITRASTDRFAVDDELVAQALDYMREHAGNPISVADLVRSVSASRRRLEERFRTVFGRSIYEEIQRQRHERAIALINEGELSLAEVAYAAGYRNARHLSVAFRTREKMAPSMYRARLLGLGPAIGARRPATR